MLRKLKATFILSILSFTLLFSSQLVAGPLDFLPFIGKDTPAPASPKPVKRKPISRSEAIIQDLPKQKIQTKVGVYILNTGKYDLQSASYRMDFYLIFNCKPSCKDNKFEIMNAIDSNIHLAIDEGTSQVYRIQADFNKAVNLRNYPFDSHTLDIIIEDKSLTEDKMGYESDPSTTALDDNLNVVGFQLLPNWSARVSKHYYQVFQETYSNYKFTMFIKRPWIAGFMKGILPALIIACCNFLALFMRIDHTAPRLSITTSTLIASEVFHLNLTSSIPPLGYVTYADMFMIINYIFLSLVLIEVVLTTHFIETAHRPFAQRLNTHCAWLIPLLWLILQMINWIVFERSDVITPLIPH